MIPAPKHSDLPRSRFGSANRYMIKIIRVSLATLIDKTDRREGGDVTLTSYAANVDHAMCFSNTDVSHHPRRLADAKFGCLV